MDTMFGGILWSPVRSWLSSVRTARSMGLIMGLEAKSRWQIESSMDKQSLRMRMVWLNFPLKTAQNSNMYVICLYYFQAILCLFVVAVCWFLFFFPFPRPSFVSISQAWKSRLKSIWPWLCWTTGRRSPESAASSSPSTWRPDPCWTPTNPASNK